MNRCILRRCIIKIAQAILVLLFGLVLWIGIGLLGQWVADVIAPYGALLKEAFGLFLLIVGLPSLLFVMLVEVYRDAKKECE